MSEQTACGGVIPESITRSWKSQPVNQIGQLRPESVAVALMTAPSKNAAIAAVLAARPDWSPSKAARYVSKTWDNIAERSERAKAYAEEDAAASDQVRGHRRRDIAGRKRDFQDLTRIRVEYNLDPLGVSAGV